MRIPSNSNFSKEIAKQFKQIFHRDMTLGGLQDLQDELNLINPVDTYLQKQVSQTKVNKNGQPKKNVPNARAVRQDYSEKESIVRTVAKSGTENKKVSLEVTSN